MSGNTSSYFEYIYDRYSAVMYGCILKIVKEKKHADTVLRSVFLGLAALSEETKAEMKDSSFWHIKYAMQKAFSFLKEYHPAAYAKAIKELCSNIRNTEKAF
jgi:hypothetical protein